jgi:hypothetical protein
MGFIRQQWIEPQQSILETFEMRQHQHYAQHHAE